MRRGESLTSPRRIRAVEKQRQALELRMAGRTFAEIAKRLGYANHAGAIAAVQTALAKTLQPTGDQFRALTLERLTKVLQVHWSAMLERDEKSSALVLRTIGDIRELLGLDAPKRQVVTGEDGGPLEYLFTLRLGERELPRLLSAGIPAEREIAAPLLPPAKGGHDRQK